MANILTKGASSDRMGEIVTIGNNQYICAYTASTSVALGVPMLITSGPEVTTGIGHSPVAIACATSAIPGALIGVCTSAIAAVGFYWFQIRGIVSAYVAGASGIIPGAGIKATNAGTNFVVDASTGVPSTATAGISRVTYSTTTPALKSVYLSGRGVQI